MAIDVWRGVRGDIRRILLSVPGVPDVAYEGRPFTPVADVAHIRERIEKGAPVPMPCRVIEERGIYVLDMNWPRKGSFADGEDTANAIAAAFSPARSIIATGSNGYLFGMVTRAGVRTAAMLDTWAQFPIRIEFVFRHQF